MKFIHAVCAAVLSAALCLPLSAQAQNFPDRPIKLVVPFAAGGVVDISGRMIAKSLASQLGKPVVVENKAGGFGMIAAESVAKATPDGYTLLIDAQGLVMNPSLRKAPYDPLADLEPVGQIMSMPFTVGVNPKLGLNSLQDLVAYAKKNPGKLNAASSGTSSQLAVALFGLKTGIDFQVISYQGAAPAATAVISGESDFIVLDLANLSQHITSGGVKGVAVTGDTRVEGFPDIPTVSELGMPDFDITSWFAVFRPKKVPADVAALLEKAFTNAVQSDEMQRYIRERSARPSKLDRAKFSEAYANEVALWARVVREANIKAD